MKRIIAAMLALTLLLAGAAFAEEAAPDVGFVFRDGVTWGMTPDEVLAAEGDPEDASISEQENQAYIAIRESSFEDIKGSLNYIFVNDALVLCGYAFEPEDTTIEAVQAKVTEAHGEPTDSDSAALVDLLSAITAPSPLDDDAYYAAWELADGTLVALTDNFGDIELAYIDAVSIRAMADATISEPAPELEMPEKGA